MGALGNMAEEDQKMDANNHHSSTLIRDFTTNPYANHNYDHANYDYANYDHNYDHGGDDSEKESPQHVQGGGSSSSCLGGVAEAGLSRVASVKESLSRLGSVKESLSRLGSVKDSLSCVVTGSSSGSKPVETATLHSAARHVVNFTEQVVRMNQNGQCFGHFTVRPSGHLLEPYLSPNSLVKEQGMDLLWEQYSDYSRRDPNLEKKFETHCRRKGVRNNNTMVKLIQNDGKPPKSNDPVTNIKIHDKEENKHKVSSNIYVNLGCCCLPKPKSSTTFGFIAKGITKIRSIFKKCSHLSNISECFSTFSTRVKT